MSISRSRFAGSSSWESCATRRGKRRGYLIFFEAKDWDDAESYLDQSPFYRNGLYERVDVASFDLEIGGVDELAHG
ncbi:MAG TPA: hypothetical protein VJP82_07895 [Sphingomicrobium sp.]|nr:hypothetical protein [Sphingomicrobium sp.]